MAPDPYPLLFEPLLKEKVWGGRRLTSYGKQLPPGVSIGESWELADLADTDVSGAGGGEARSVIRNGPLKGGTLSEVVRLWGTDLLGEAAPTSWGGFPLLVKYLDAREHLSVQVHPSEAYAREHAGAHLKTECWYVLEAEPGSVIFKGVRDGVDADSFVASIERGDVQDKLTAVPARAGDMHLLPSGTCHALGAGVLVAEIQTPSDTTFRVYDWTREYGRTERELHLEQALSCIRFGPAPASTRRCSSPIARLVDTEYFCVDEVLVDEGKPLVSEDRRCAVIMAVEGPVNLEPLRPVGEPGVFSPVSLSKGDTVLIPAALGARCTADRACSVLVARL